MLAALLFDMDGTLADTDPFHYQAWWELLKAQGVEINETIYKTRMTGKLNPAIIRDLLPELSLEEGIAFADRKEAYFRELAIQDLKPLPGLLDIINWATDQELQQAVVTNAPPANAHFMLEVLNLQNRFDYLVISEELGIGKPDPAPYQAALDRFGIVAGQAIAFEDSPAGIRSAIGAGILTIGICTTQSPETLYELGAKLVVEDFRDRQLQDWLKTLPIGNSLNSSGAAPLQFERVE
jgi:HAD superfamily hydrolase (TIGR01509 family)